MKHFRSIAITAAALVLASCTLRSGREGAVTIASLRGPSSVAMVQWLDSLDRTDAATTEITIYDEPLQLRKAMLEGSVDFAVLPTTMAALMYNNGIDYRILGVPLWGTLYLCGTDTSVRSISDLKGKRVYNMARGMTPDVLFTHLLQANGLESGTDVVTDYRFPTHIDLANAAIAGRVPLCVLSEPFASQVANANPRFHILIDLGDEWEKIGSGALAGTAFLCRGDLAGSALSRTVCNAYSRSADWVNANPQCAAALAARFGINPDTAAVRKSIPNSHIKFVGTPLAKTDIKSYIALFLQSSPDAVGGRMPDDDFYAD